MDKAVMSFQPFTGIEIDWKTLRRFSCWRRQAMALLVHELVHVLQWYVCGKSVLRWNSLVNAEELPNRIQDVILTILFVRLVEN